MSNKILVPKVEFLDNGTPDAMAEVTLGRPSGRTTTATINKESFLRLLGYIRKLPIPDELFMDGDNTPASSEEAS